MAMRRQAFERMSVLCQRASDSEAEFPSEALAPKHKPGGRPCYYKNERCPVDPERCRFKHHRLLHDSSVAGVTTVVTEVSVYVGELVILYSMSWR